MCEHNWTALHGPNGFGYMGCSKCFKSRWNHDLEQAHQAPEAAKNLPVLKVRTPPPEWTYIGPQPISDLGRSIYGERTKCSGCGATEGMLHYRDCPRLRAQAAIDPPVDFNRPISDVVKVDWGYSPPGGWDVPKAIPTKRPPETREEFRRRIGLDVDSTTTPGDSTAIHKALRLR